MSRQDCNQAQQRAKVARRRRTRGAPELKHGARSQSGVKIRSREAWAAYVAYRKIVLAENRRIDKMKAEWRARAAEKRASS